jgi:hypothetical protein
MSATSEGPVRSHYRGLRLSIAGQASGGRPMDFSDSRLWYSVIGLIVILLVIVYEVWFTGITIPQ